MAMHPSVAFNHRKKRIYQSNIITPTTHLSKISQTDQFSNVKQKKNISSNKIAPELKPVQDWRSMNTSKDVGIQQSRPNLEGEFLEAQPFLENPVLFNFGDDYGNQLFLDLQEEVSYQRHNYGLSQGDRGIYVVEEGIKYSRDDIYILSTETDMIDYFLRDKLF